MLDVYTWEPNANSGKPLLMLNEKGVEFTHRYVDIGRREQHSAAYLELNPNGTVPTVVHDGRVLTESSPTLEYLDAACEGVPLRPEEPSLRWRMRTWIRFMDLELCPALAMFGGAGASARMPAQAAEAIEAQVRAIPMPERRRVWRLVLSKQVPELELAESDQRVRAGIERFERALGDYPYLAGPRYSLADVVVMITVFSIPASRPEEVNDRRTPRFMDWLRRCHARPGTRAAFAMGHGWVAGRVAETRKILGV